MDRDPVESHAAETVAAQAGRHVDEHTGAIIPPLVPSATFARDPTYALVGQHVYARQGSPTVDAAEAILARLDAAADSLLFGSGMAGIAAVLETVGPGGHVVAPEVMYHGARDRMRRLAELGRIDVTFFDPADPAGLPAALRPGHTELVWIETPVNPTWDVLDIAAAAAATHEAGARLVVDSTVAPPPTTRPLELGADLVFQSATKYLNGHSDLTAGVVSTAVCDERWEELRRIRTSAGSILGTFETWLLIRGLRTLWVRFARASANALALAERFRDDGRVAQVLYPGLPSHPGHDIARRQMTGGFGGMLSLLVRGGADHARAVAAATRVFLPATSLGGVESLIEHRASVEGSHGVVPANLLRLSVGIEALADLVADLDRALDAP